MDYIYLLAGFVLLIASGEILVRGGVDLARTFKVSSLLIGFTVISFGTSAPELFVSLSSAISGHPEIAIGNVIGSNIANIGFILGITAMILPISAQSETIRFGWPMMFLSAILLFAFSLDSVIHNREGFVLFAFLILFILFSIRRSRANHVSEEILPPRYNVFIAVVMVVASCIGLAYGSDLLVKNASSIARGWGISERVISITVIAVGTSLPELTASIIAAYKGESDISIGNIIGSNIFNILAVIGLTASVKSIYISFDLFKLDLLWMFAFTILLLVFLIPFGKRFHANRNAGKSFFSAMFSKEGGVLLRSEAVVLFFGYLIYIYLLF